MYAVASFAGWSSTFVPLTVRVSGFANAAFTAAAAAPGVMPPTRIPAIRTPAGTACRWAFADAEVDKTPVAITPSAAASAALEPRFEANFTTNSV